MALNIIGIIVLLGGFFDLIWRIWQWLQGSVLLSLRSSEAVIKWHATKTTYYAYLGAKKLLKISKKIPNPLMREQAILKCRELLTVRHQLYKSVKVAGVNSDAFIAMTIKSNKLYTQFIEQLSD